MRALNIAHRGGAALWPENSRTAFENAIARGCDGAELDVQLSRDGVAVVHHDFRLKDGLARRDGAWLSAPGPRIRDLSYAELEAYDIGMPAPGSDYAAAHPLLRGEEGARIPALAEIAALAASAPRPFSLFVELKCDASDDSADPNDLADAAHAVIAAAAVPAIFVGFDWRALARIRARAPDAEVWFTTDRLQGDARGVIDGIAAAGAAGWFADYPDATPEAVAHARGKGLKVGAWTVNDAAAMRRLADLDAICTDRPDLLQALE
jgi:glycerophosphoryl diester phosphodiesterase